MSVHRTIVFGFANKSWLGNQHGKHTSAIEKHFLCLATGKNLVCFFLLLCHVALVTATTWWSLQKGKGVRGERESAFKQQHKFSLKAAMQGPVWLGSVPATYWPGRGQGVGPLPLPVFGFPLTPHCSWGPSAFPLPGGLGIDCFYERNMTQKSIQHDQLCTWKSPQLYFPSSSVQAPVC